MGQTELFSWVLQSVEEKELSNKKSYFLISQANLRAPPPLLILPLLIFRVNVVISSILFFKEKKGKEKKQSW